MPDKEEVFISICGIYLSKLTSPLLSKVACEALTESIPGVLLGAFVFPYVYICMYIYIYVYIHIYIMTTVLSELMFPPPSQMQRVRCWPWSRAKRGENFDCPRRHLRRRRCNEQAAILAQEWGGRSR